MTGPSTVAAAARRWPILLLCLVLGVGGAALLTWQGPRDYSSTTRLSVSFESPEPATDGEGHLYLVIADNLDSIVEFARRPEMAARTTGTVGGGTEVIAGAVEVTSIEDTGMIDITATDHDPERARDIAAAYANVVTVESRAAGPDVATVLRVVRPPAVAEEAEPLRWSRNLALGAAAGLPAGLLFVLVSALSAVSARRTPPATPSRRGA